MKTVRFNDFSQMEKETCRTIDSRGYMTVTGNKVARAGVQYYHGIDFLKEDLAGFEQALGRSIGAFDKIGFYRPPEVVFSPDVMDAYDNIDITINHPDDKDVNASTYSMKKVVGHAISKGRRVGDWMEVDLIIKDQAGINAINAGMNELSAGYDSGFKVEQGTADNGDKYDMILTNIIPNHIAICENGRAGHSARLNDSSSKPEKHRMKIKLTDGRTVELSDDNASIVQDELNNAAAAVERAEREKASIEAERDSYADQNKELKAKTTDSVLNERLSTLISARDGAQILTGKVTDSTCLDVNVIRANALDAAGIPCRFSDSGKWAEADPIKTEARFDTEIDRRKEADAEKEETDKQAAATHAAFSNDVANAKVTDSIESARNAARDNYFERQQQASKQENK